MSNKHSLNLSNDSDVNAVARRRQLTAERNRQYRARQRALQARSTQPTHAQLQQGEVLINLVPLEEEQASQTQGSLGIRVQGVTLPQDSQDAASQAQAQSMNEHDILLSQEQVIPTQTLPTPLQSGSFGFFRQFAAPKSLHTSRLTRGSHQGQAGLPQYNSARLPSDYIAPRITRPQDYEQFTGESLIDYSATSPLPEVENNLIQHDLPPDLTHVERRVTPTNLSPQISTEERPPTSWYVTV